MSDRTEVVGKVSGDFASSIKSNPIATVAITVLFLMTASAAYDNYCDRQERAVQISNIHSRLMSLSSNSHTIMLQQQLAIGYLLTNMTTELREDPK